MLLKARVGKAYAQITQSRTTASFFVFTFIYCLVQAILQSLLFSIDEKYVTLVSDIVEGANIPPANFTFLDGHRDHLHLQICDDVPTGQTPYPCTTVYPSEDSMLFIQSLLDPPLVLNDWEQGFNVTAVLNTTNVGVQIKTPNTTVFLTEQCVQVLLYPSQVLRNFVQEEITLMYLQFWLLAISFFIILNDSVPHTLAALITRALETGWAMYAAWRGPYFQANFRELLAHPGSPCSLDLFSDYWMKRQVYELADLVLSTTGLFVFSYLSWTLLKRYSAQSFKCVGAPQHVMRTHKFFMAVLACLQLEVFVLVTGMGLWSKTLMTSAMAHASSYTLLYKALIISTMILLVPWIAMGWYSIRREMKTMMIFFLGAGFIITTGWALMFYSIVYRWSFLQWPYLGCYTVASFILLVASMVLGIICRVNFGKGLAQYLNAEETLASLNFASDSFSHDTNTRRMNAHLSKELDMKILDLDAEDHQYCRPHSMQLYFVPLPSLSKDGPGGDPEHQQQQAVSRPSSFVKKDHKHQPYNVPF